MDKNKLSQAHQQKFLTSLRYYVHNSFTEMKRRPCYFCLSFFSVAIVVAASAVAQSVIDRAPIIFLKTAEGPAGEIDIELKANNDLLQTNAEYGSISYLNATRIREVLPEEYNKMVTPRHQFTANSYIECKTSIEQVEEQCSNKRQGAMISLDSLQEEEIGLGRQYPFKELSVGEGIIAENYAGQLGIQAGDTLYMELITKNYFSTIRDNLCFKEQFSWCESSDFLFKVSSLIVGVKIVDILDSNYGKVGNNQAKTFVLTEQKQLNQFLAQHLLLSDNSQLLEFGEQLKSIDPQEFSGKVLLNAQDRVDLYLESNYDTIQLRLSKMGSQIAQMLGVYPIKIDLPVLAELYKSRFGSMFLGVVLNMIIFILFVLSLMLLYNLLLVSIETKNFELGVLRTLGLNKIGVVSLIIIQSLSYVIPAIISGLLLSVVGLQFISDAINGQLGVSISVIPTVNAFIFSMIVGILIPIFASIFPIRKALEQQLSIALDINRSKSTAVKIEVDVEGKGFPYGRVGFALISSLFGISIYYFLPLSLLTFNLGLLINIFFWILIGMLIGFILLMLNVQYLIEKMVVYTTLFWTGSAMKSLILKNLGCHRIKNRRVAIMYSLSIAFIIFVWSFSNIQSKSSEFAEKKEHGTYIDVQLGDNYSYNRKYLNIGQFERFITQELSEEVESYSWVTTDLSGFMNSKAGFRNVYMTHSGRIYQEFPEIIGVSPNFMKNTFSKEFLQVKERFDKNLDLDIVQELYTPRGSQSMIIAAKTQEFLRADVDYDSSLFLVLNNGTYSRQHQMRVSAVIDSSPVFYTASSVGSSVVVSLPTYMRLCGDTVTGFNDMPMQKLLIKTVNQDKETVDKVYGRLNTFISKNDIDAKVWDYRNFQKDVKQQQDVTNMIFTVITILVMVLCFFSLVSSMTANILEQSKEIAVLRAVGITKSQMIRLYVLEAYTLVFSSSLIGMAVGIAVGFTMGMQRALFTNLPIPFEFPTQIFISIFASSIVCAFLSTYTPSKKVMNNQISQIIRMTG